MLKGCVIENAVFLFFTGIKINLLNHILIFIFGKKPLYFLANRLDGRLVRLKKEFALMEKRQLAFFDAAQRGEVIG